MPSERVLFGGGVYQTLMTTPLGTGIIIQEYMNMNPELVIDFVLKEITREAVEYGYKYSENNIVKVIDGKALRGKHRP